MLYFNVFLNEKNQSSLKTHNNLKRDKTYTTSSHTPRGPSGSSLQLLPTLPFNYSGDLEWPLGLVILGAKEYMSFTSSVLAAGFGLWRTGEGLGTARLIDSVLF